VKVADCNFRQVERRELQEEREYTYGGIVYILRLIGGIISPAALTCWSGWSHAVVELDKRVGCPGLASWPTC
jgi:hypothetical protein